MISTCTKLKWWFYLQIECHCFCLWFISGTSPSLNEIHFLCNLILSSFGEGLYKSLYFVVDLASLIGCIGFQVMASLDETSWLQGPWLSLIVWFFQSWYFLQKFVWFSKKEWRKLLALGWGGQSTRALFATVLIHVNHHCLWSPSKRTKNWSQIAWAKIHLNYHHHSLPPVPLTTL